MNKSNVLRSFSGSIWNPIMLVLVFFIVFVISIFPKPWHSILFNIAFTLLFVSAVMTMSKHRGLMLMLVAVALGMEWISSLIDMVLLDTISKILNFGFFAFMAGYYIHQIARARKVTARVILQAIIGYLLLGLVFSILVALLGEYNPAMFSFPAAMDIWTENNHFSDYLYYGFVTITTLGYGDIVPLMPFSRSLSILISVSGQLYLAVIIALLVGKYASQRD